ncbi:spore cortex biosynthesis protein YabQ [Paramaledivibacter caminithermalis]|jgi:spore cortex biosynthesis protein YabQ|uniref:Spore cortex biosynthesis protein YabQ n=1 Tax=Paramaledivibacter caminithermalis (strain DSM 15212 / CIP 107654 / DViRD3) TaxID=1121301 RepID=A0A1M6QNE6_PARC5|nr:spore cortex biosynthesis protein YabQ [Paramaledivibacter caminithermalis]SHK21685.1 spore cortex biosynthesis protein YabQ [Paramaledivibacter caminithermalis DSM 15212]
MSTLVYYQLYVFLTTFYGGIVIGFMYDIYKIYRDILNTRKFIAIIQDILFWITISIVVICVLIYSDDGKIRGYSIIGFILGALIYNLLLSRIVVKTIKIFLSTIKNILYKIHEKVLKIFEFFYKCIMYPYNKIYKLIKPLIIKLKKFLSIPKTMVNEIKKYSKTILNKK